MPKIPSSERSESSKQQPPRLRFAALVRVSTEKQEKVGESLPVQRRDNERDVERLGGTIVDWYGGQEHATPGHEKKEIDRLLADAAKGKFDALIIKDIDRWSRDNEKSKQGLEVLRKHRVKFYVSTMPINLYDPNQCSMLTISTAINEITAQMAQKKSIESRILRARRGLPTAGRQLPFGRTYDKKTQTWGLDPAKKALIEDVAARYLADASLPALAEEYGIDHSYLCQVLRERCGDTWTLHFQDDRFAIDDTVEVPVPRLLDDKVIRALKRKLEANRTYLHKPPSSVHDYLLGGHIFCADCGRLLTGQIARSQPKGKAKQTGKLYLYYRHPHPRKKKDEHGNTIPDPKKCTAHPVPFVRADWIEQQVVFKLFKMFGNPAEIKRAVASAVPDCDQAMKRQQRLQGELDKVEAARGRILGLICKNLITDEQAEKDLRALQERERLLRDDLDQLADTLANVPTEEQLHAYVEAVESQMGRSIFVYDENTCGHSDPDEGGPPNKRLGGNDISTWLAMTREDKRALLRAVFDLPGGKAGVFISPAPCKPGRKRKQWAFTIRGQLAFECVVPQAQHSPSPCQN